MLARREQFFPKLVAGGICAALLFCGATAFAQDEEEEEEKDKTEEPKPVTTAPVTTVAPAPVRVLTGTDHNAMVGKFGVSWFGVSSIPIATGTPAGTGDDPEIAPGPPASVSTPAIGVRYWLNDRIGIDAGAGLSIAAGDARNVTSGIDKQTIFSMLAHAGMPFNVASGKHISLQLIPEMNLGFAVSSVEPTQQPNPPPNATLTGVRLDVGARLGGEVHFGFMDIPELSLEGSVGLFLTYQATKAEVATAFASQYNILVTTAAYQNPWDIFTSYVRARYYF